MELIEKQGYKQTELGWIPEDWSTNKLTEVVEYIHGKAHEQDIDENGQYIVANSKFISTDGLIKKFSKKIHCEAKKGDVLTVLSDIPNGKALAKCFYVESDNEITVNQRICIWRSKNSHPKFNFYKLNRLPYFLSINDGVNQTNIGNSDIEKCIVVMPSLKEQKNIATALTDVDELIANLDKLITKKKAIKQGAMQSLLTGVVRIKGYNNSNDYRESNYGKIPTDWNIESIGNICNIFGRIGFRGYTVNDIVNEGKGALSLSPSNILNNRIDFKKGTFISWMKYHESPEIKIRKGDIVLVKTASVGKTAIIENLPYKITLNPQLVVLKKIKIDKYYLSYMMSYKIIQNQIITSVAGGVVPTLTQEQISGFTFPIPNSLEEQKAISKTLFEMDSEIQLLEAKKAKYQNIKQGMMQELLTGKTRLV